MKLALQTTATAPASSRQLLLGVEKSLGFVPNLMGVMANSPAALEGYLSLSGSLAKGGLPAGLREQIALAVAEINGCGYCLSAHTLLGSKAGLADEEIQSARRASSTDEKTHAVLQLARAITLQRGSITDAEFEGARSAGLSDAEILEVVAHVALNILTNYTNNLARTTIDFPEVKPGEFATESCTVESCGCGH